MKKLTEKQIKQKIDDELDQDIERTEVNFDIECCACDNNEGDTCLYKYSKQTKKIISDRMIKDGWDYGYSNEYDVEGLLCPDCIAKSEISEISIANQVVDKINKSKDFKKIKSIFIDVINDIKENPELEYLLRGILSDKRL